MGMSWPSGASSVKAAALIFLVALLAWPIRNLAGTLPLSPGANGQTGFHPDLVRFDAAAETELVTLINKARADNGLPPLTVDSRLTHAARKHSERMAQDSVTAHQLEGEPPLPTRITNEGLPADGVSENIASTNRNILTAHDGLMHSAPHRRTILDPHYDAIGVGVIRDGDDIYVTEDFARKLPEYSERQAEAVVQAAIAQYAKAHGLNAPSRSTELQLRRMACSMALRDKLESGDALRLTGARGVLAWTATDPAKLPKGIAQVLSQQTSGDALGACFAPSVSHPGGVYWIVMVTY
jgi:uncharacterized protein YkwD